MACPSQINHSEINPALFDDFCRWVKVECVGAFVDDDSGVGAEFPCELAVGGVDGVDTSGVCLEQAIGEPAGGAAEVCAEES